MIMLCSGYAGAMYELCHVYTQARVRVSLYIGTLGWQDIWARSKHGNAAGSGKETGRDVTYASAAAQDKHRARKPDPAC